MLPGQPTVARVFSSNEEVAVFGEVYDNDTAPHKVDITTTLRADDGRDGLQERRGTRQQRACRQDGRLRHRGAPAADGSRRRRRTCFAWRRVRGWASDKTASREVQIGVVRPETGRHAPTAATAEARATGMTATSLFRGSQSAIVTPREAVHPHARGMGRALAAASAGRRGAASRLLASTWSSACFSASARAAGTLWRSSA